MTLGNRRFVSLTVPYQKKNEYLLSRGGDLKGSEICSERLGHAPGTQGLSH